MRREPLPGVQSGAAAAHLISLGACDSSGALQREGSVLEELGNQRCVLPPWRLGPKARLMCDPSVHDPLMS